VLAVAAGIGLRAEMAAEIVVAVDVLVVEVDGVVVAVDVRAAVVVIEGAVGVLVAVGVAGEDTKLLCHGYSRITRINQEQSTGKGRTKGAAFFSVRE
jgi:hypothetical protein